MPDLGEDAPDRRVGATFDPKDIRKTSPCRSTGIIPIEETNVALAQLSPTQPQSKMKAGNQPLQQKQRLQQVFFPRGVRFEKGVIEPTQLVSF